ncbi:MAG: hypothetical protein CMO98_01330 [Woeseia sp.]|nr:hypothetical protein [Woeseia sp.]|tara:strand:- start:431 stop:715 length:285 start_codon:yes stop_codon:yes gene_type:complete
MNNKVDDADAEETNADIDEFDEEEISGTIDIPESNVSDNVDDVFIDSSVEGLIPELDSSDDKDAARKKEVRRKLEELVEEKSVVDTYAIDFDDE